MEIYGKNFQPPRCPRRNCRAHKGYDNPQQWSKWGTYTKKPSGQCIQRFKCKVCGDTYSRQAFSWDYWLKKPQNLHTLVMSAVGGACNRQVARILGCSSTTVDRQLARVARQAAIFHWSMVEKAAPPTEIEIDGFETFELSQYFPMHFHLSVDKPTQFIWYMTDSPLRRKGRMTPYQKERRSELEQLYGLPDPKAIQKDMNELLRYTLRDAVRAVVYSDKHPAYPIAMRGLATEIIHLTISSKEYRGNHNMLRDINLADRLLRHSVANHRRETIAFAKRRNGAAERIILFMVWRNYHKGVSEKDSRSPSPAMMLGLTDHRLSIEEMFGERLFPDDVDLPPRWRQYYRREVETVALPINRRHDLRFAF